MRELHMRTGKWVRKAAQANGVIVVERGHPVATILPFSESDTGALFSKRRLVPGFARLPKIATDSTATISEERGRA